MYKTVLVKPLDKRRVINPDTKRPLPGEGAKVVLSSYWKRREKAGEVVISPVNQETEE